MSRANNKGILKDILIQNFNATIHFDRVDMKPGKSTMFATCKVDDEQKYFLCMSANPATVPIVTQIFLLPFLDQLRLYLHKDSTQILACAYQQKES
ncbi:gephyrin-like [Monomorium pharaonis]|uniref:gephyrin-like n=1 Tax=Monomorium pharaonis TaxID=307658 RepID=UPI001745E661|nr:gephyrin-like [Monomorium pharaonis]